MFAYHMKPQDMRGDRLLPLNSFRDSWPDLYAKHADKYLWREDLTKLIIPKANCLWNDVIHLSLVHPNEIFSLFRQAHEACGKSYEREMEFFEIPLSRIPQKDSFFYFQPADDLNEDKADYTPENQAKCESICEEHIFQFSEELLHQAANLPDQFREYVHFKVARDRRALLFATVPHLLVRGPIDVSHLRTVQWSTPR